MKSPVVPSEAERSEAKSRDLFSRRTKKDPSAALRFARDDGLGRRSFLGAAALLPFGARVLSAAPPPEQITPALIEAAKKEGKVSYYTAMDLSVAEPMARTFEAKYPGIKVTVERTGSERLFNRIAQEAASNIRKVDVANSADAAHFLPWKRQGWLAPYVTVDMAENVPAEQRDPDGTYVNQRTHLSAIAYNTKLVKPEDAPKGFVDLLDPKYAGKMVKGHPGYSGTIMTATQQIVRELGWEYFEKLGKQKVLQVQSATEPPKKIEAGERAIAVDGSDYLFWMAKERGSPIEVVHAVEGTPLITNPMAVFKAAPNPNAARLLVAWIMSAEGQQFIVDLSGQYPANKLVKAKAGRPALASIKTFKEDPAAVEKQADEIKARYAKIFKV
ncbi:MAG: extracellular solute-binding protein [Rhodospirillaceae bacterium]|nr:extracellular solute-binding protein [Rhodospirillaceae bacterium]